MYSQYISHDLQVSYLPLQAYLVPTPKYEP
jgi:hypothetical protein